MAANVSRAWHEHLTGRAERPATPLISPMTMTPTYHDPLGAYATAPGGPDADRRLVEHLDRTGARAALLLAFDRALQLPGVPTVKVALALTRAINDWLVDRMLPVDERLLG